MFVKTQSHSTQLYCVKDQINIAGITSCKCAVMICSIAATLVAECAIRFCSTAATHVAECRTAGPLFYSIHFDSMLRDNPWSRDISSSVRESGD
jgi:hypothetical protein